MEHPKFYCYLCCKEMNAADALVGHQKDGTSVCGPCARKLHRRVLGIKTNKKGKKRC